MFHRLSRRIVAAFGWSSPQEPQSPPAEALETDAVAIEEPEAARIELPPFESTSPPPAPPPAVCEAGLQANTLGLMLAEQTGKRADALIASYQAMLDAAEERVREARRSLVRAWTFGGAMAAVTALGATWSAWQITSSRGQATLLAAEVASQREKVTLTSQYAAERDRLHMQLHELRETHVQSEIEAIRLRLDAALAASAERELRRATEPPAPQVRTISHRPPATQPLSAVTDPVDGERASPAAATAAPTTQPTASTDAWSLLLNGQ